MCSIEEREDWSRRKSNVDELIIILRNYIVSMIHAKWEEVGQFYFPINPDENQG